MGGVTLKTGCTVHIEYNVNLSFWALLDYPVKITEIPFAVFVEYFCTVIVGIEISVPEGDTDAVEAHFLDLVKVIFRDPVVLICIHQRVCSLCAEAVNENLKHIVMILRFFIGRKPILLNEPWTEVHAAENNFLTFLIVDFIALCYEKILLSEAGVNSRRRSAERKG